MSILEQIVKRLEEYRYGYGYSVETYDAVDVVIRSIKDVIEGKE